MIRYAMTVSNSTRDEEQELTSYGLRAMNEKGEELLSIPNISTREEDVAYLVEHFNQVRVHRDQFYSQRRKMNSMFGKKRQLEYDKTRKRPVIRASICTGEQVAGFKDLETGKFEDIMLISNEKDMKEFMRMYGIQAEDISKEW